MPGRNAFANLNPCFYHSSEPVIYSTLLTYKSGQAQHKSSYLPAVHHCISMFCAAASNSLGNANITIILWWILMGWALNADTFTKHDGSLQILGGQIKPANWQTGHSLCVFFKEKNHPLQLVFALGFQVSVVDLGTTEEGGIAAGCSPPKCQELWGAVRHGLQQGSPHSHHSHPVCTGARLGGVCPRALQGPACSPPGQVWLVHPSWAINQDLQKGLKDLGSQILLSYIGDFQCWWNCWQFSWAPDSLCSMGGRYPIMALDSLPPSPTQKGGKAFSVSLYTQGKQCKKAVWKLLIEFMDVAKHDWNYACKCG